MMKGTRLPPWLVPLALVGCSTPMTQIGSVSPEQVQAERFKEQQLVIQSMVDDKRRLDDVSFGLLRAASPLCSGALTTRLGVSLINRSAFDDEYLEAARGLGYSDTLEFETVAQGSAADRAGLKARDRVLALNGEPLPRGNGAPEQFTNRLSRTQSRVSITFLRDSIVRSVSVPRDTVCDIDVAQTRDPRLAMNASSLGRQILVSTDLIRFTANDNELATIVGHEIGHSVMHHTDAKERNALLGAIGGLVMDLAFAKGGINTGGKYSNEFAQIGATAFSQDFEREADYVGLSIFAAAGHPTSAAPAVWRHMAQLEPAAIMFGTTHPTTAERYVRLGQWGQEIDKQMAAGNPLRLAMKDGSLSVPIPVVRAESSGTGVAARVVAQSPTPSRVSQSGTPAPSIAGRTAASANALTDRSRDQPKNAGNSAPAAAASPRALSKPSRILRSDSTVAVAIIGPPSSDSARLAALGVFSIARSYFDRHEWGKAEDWFKHTLELDGSLATYHAGLGSVEMILEKWEEAEAEYTAALMIDLGNQEYRAQIMEARRRKGR